MKRNTLMLIVGLVITASMILAACQPAPAETPAEPPVVEEPAADTPVAEKPTAEEPAAEEPAAEEPVMSERAPVVRYAVLEDMTTTNVWALYDDTDSSFWNYLVTDVHWPSLYTLSDKRWDFIPMVAEGLPEPFVEEDGFYVSTIKLQDGLMWNDGSPLTAEDVAFTANTQLALRMGGNWLGQYNAEYLNKVEAVDDLHVKFYYNIEPGLSLWQYGTLQGNIVSSAYWQPKLADALAMVEGVDYESEEGIATVAEAIEIVQNMENEGEPFFGEWVLNKWEVGAFSESVVNENNNAIGNKVEMYENGAFREVSADGSYEFSAYGEPTGEKTLEYVTGPFFDSALYSVYNADAAVLALRNDDVDYILTPNGISQGFVDQLETDDEITIITNKANGFRFLAFNYAREELADPVLHQAVACMIDLDFLAERVLQGQALPVYTLVPEGLTFWHNKEVTRWCEGQDAKGRMETAVGMLKDAGYSWEVEPSWNEARGGSVNYGEGLILPNGTPMPEYTLLAPSAGYDPLRATAGVYIEQWMSQLGMPVSAELTNFNNIISAVYETGDYDMFILGWGLTAFPDYLCDFFDQVGGNPYNYDSPALAEKCVALYSETDMDAAQQIAMDIQVLLSEELPYITLFTTPMVDAFRNIEFPYTEVLDGIGPGYYGRPTLANALE